MNVIHLNVGGAHFAALRETLTKQKGSYLWALLNGRYPIHKDSAGRIFIDRDGETFQDVLFYLRTGVILPQESPRKQLKFKTELEFFTHGYISLLCEESNILNDVDKRQIFNWLPGDKPIHTKLLFRASDYNFSAAAFHHACQGHDNTLVVAKAGREIFGGYSGLESWVFAIGRGKQQSARRPHPSSGPSFEDFTLGDQCDIKANSSICFLPGQIKICEYEVYQLK